MTPNCTIVTVLMSVIAAVVFLTIERPQTRRVIDASKAYTLSFSPTGIFAPSGYTIRVSGKIDGRAVVALPSSDPQELTGDVDWTIGHDFFESPLIAQYRPNNVRSGQLTFRVVFQ